MEGFRKLGLSAESIEVLRKKGFKEPTIIQAKAIPLLLEGKKDIVGQSQTGTGKTASFALPILEQLRPGRDVKAIILTPTRELALQVAKEIDSLKGHRKVRVLAVYGGAPIGPQRQRLRAGVDIVVGTPGRIMDLQERGSLRLDHIRYAVLDEADEMLNMGFVEDIETILENTPKDKTMLLFSATMPKPILNIAKKYMREYELIEVQKAHIITDTVEQVYYDINSKDRIEGLRRIFDYYKDFYGIVFCNTKATVDMLAQKLKQMGYSAAALHGDITQGQREEILQQFRNRNIRILVATDVAARGIDVNDLTHVINYSLPQSPESYVHRIGRTGRAGKKGVSITFVIPFERRKLSFVERINRCKLKRQKLPSGKDILEKRENEVKDILNRIIDANKRSKFNVMADELSKGRNPNEVIAAVLKYCFRNDLEMSYKDLTVVKNEPNRTKKRFQKRFNKRFDKKPVKRGPGPMKRFGRRRKGSKK